MILLFIGFWSIGFLCSTGFWVWRFESIFKSYRREREQLFNKIEKQSERIIDLENTYEREI